MAADQRRAAEHARAAAGARPSWRAGRAHGAVGGELRGLADLPQVRSRQRAGRPRSAVRLPLRRARRDRRRLHGRHSGRQAAPVGPRGLPVHPLQPCSRLPERQPAARRYRRACVGRRRRQSDNREVQRALASPLQQAAQVPGPASSASSRDSSGRRPGCSRDPSDWRPSPSASTSGNRACRGCPSPRWAIQTRSLATSTGARALRPGYRAALHIDRADWDDPDYMFLALVGGDRPGRTCQDEPGEAI